MDNGNGPIYSEAASFGHMISKLFFKYLLLTECEVRTASYGPSFFVPFMAQARSARGMKTSWKEKNEDP